MAKELQPVVLRLKTWRAQNDISQAEAAELLRRRGLPIRLRTLQAWEAGRSAPNPFAAVASRSFLINIPLSRLNAIRADPARMDFTRDVSPRSGCPGKQ
jgi:transcriptional regulator with XRE-family HTH domain